MQTVAVMFFNPAGQLLIAFVIHQATRIHRRQFVMIQHDAQAQARGPPPLRMLSRRSKTCHLVDRRSAAADQFTQVRQTLLRWRHSSGTTISIVPIRFTEQLTVEQIGGHGIIETDLRLGHFDAGKRDIQPRGFFPQRVQHRLLI